MFQHLRPTDITNALSIFLKAGILSTLFLFQSNYCSGQLMGINPGINMHFTKPNGLNFIVDRYNETRSFLDQEMKPFNHFNGFTYGFFVGGYNLFFEAGYDNRSQTRSAVGVDASNREVERKLRAAINTGNIGLGYSIAAEEGFALVLGVRANVGSFKIKTKVGPVDTVDDEEWEDLLRQVYLDTDLGLKLITPIVMLELYYAFPNRTNLFEVNKELNPNTYQNDPTELPFRNGGLGLKIMLAISNATIGG